MTQDQYVGDNPQVLEVDVPSARGKSIRNGLYMCVAGVALLGLLVFGAREKLQGNIGRNMRMPFSGQTLYEGIIGEQPGEGEELPMMGSYGQGN